MGKINAVWHRAHRMPKNPTLDQRIEWHLAHAPACGCREVPAGIRGQLEKRGIPVPRFSGPEPARSRRSA